MRKLLLLLLIFAPCFASASDWVLLHKSAYSVVEGRHMTSEIYADRNSIATDGSVKTAWWKELMTANGGEPTDILSLGVFHCQHHMYHVERVLTRKTSSEQYKSWADQFYDFDKRIRPDDSEDFVFSAVCLNMWKQG